MASHGLIATQAQVENTNIDTFPNPAGGYLTLA